MITPVFMVQIVDGDKSALRSAQSTVESLLCKAEHDSAQDKRLFPVYFLVQRDNEHYHHHRIM